MRTRRATLVLAVLVAAGCAPEQHETAKALPPAKATRWGFAVEDLARLEALSGGGRVRLAVPRQFWREVVAALDSANEAGESGPLGPRSPVLRFALRTGGEVTLDLVGREHWRLVRREGETPLAPCPALKTAAGVALRLACAAGADEIVVAGVAPGAAGARPVLEVVRTLKGSAVAGARLEVEGTPLPSPGGPDVLCLAFLRVEADGRGAPRFHRLLPVGTLWDHSGPMEAKMRESIPLPDTWGKAVGGLRMGLRAREAEIEPGGELPVEVCIQNVGKQPIRLLRHRLNIHDYYPHTRFTVAAPDGTKRELAKPLGPKNEFDAPLAATLQPGEAYIHTVRLSQWPVAEPGALARGAFARPGRYAINCTYSVTPRGEGKGLWAGTLTAAPITIRVLPERRRSKDSGVPI